MTDACYVCSQPITETNPSYPGLCLPCGNLNLLKRNQTADMSGHNCLVSGGRIKIGFETALKLLRAGATVTVTTRFASDARQRFAKQPDSYEWIGRLRVWPADFRVLACVEGLVNWISAEMGTLDVLVNNAAQTVRRPPVFYKHLLEPRHARVAVSPLAECFAGPQADALEAIQAAVERRLGHRSPRLDSIEIAHMSQVVLTPDDENEDTALFPPGQYDKDGQQEDRRPFNSWMMGLTDVSVVEFLEVLYINVVAPFMLCSGLKPVMSRAAGQRPSLIVNVTAMEGNFADPEKNARHPHTNMAKAALNMMTRTSAIEYRQSGILMNAVDPGWITCEKPFPLSQERAERRVRLAIDEIDGAARVCDPIFRAVNDGDCLSGVLFKNYAPYQW